MKVNGFQIREAIRRWELRRDTAAGQFTGTLMKFADEEKTSPDEVAKLFVEAEAAVARLQAAQARYNLAVTVEAAGEKFTLCEAVKRLGGAGRLEKMWRTATTGEKDRYNSYRDEATRNKDEIRAQRTLSTKETLVRASKAGAFAGALRAGIAEGNGTKLEGAEIGLDPTLLTE